MALWDEVTHWTDTGGGVHTVVVTDASVHDSCVMEDLLHGDERVIYGDKGYVSEERRGSSRAFGKDMAC